MQVRKRRNHKGIKNTLRWIKIKAATKEVLRGNFILL